MTQRIVAYNQLKLRGPLRDWPVGQLFTLNCPDCGDDLELATEGQYWREDCSCGLTWRLVVQAVGENVGPAKCRACKGYDVIDNGDNTGFCHDCGSEKILSESKEEAVDDGNADTPGSH